MHTLEALAARESGAGMPPLLAIDWPLQHLPQVVLDAEAAQRLLQGRKVSTEAAPAQRVRIYHSDGHLLALGEVDVTGLVQPRRIINVAE